MCNRKPEGSIPQVHGTFPPDPSTTKPPASFPVRGNLVRSRKKDEPFPSIDFLRPKN